MPNFIPFWIILGAVVAGGIAVSLQAAVMGKLTRSFGLLENLFLVYCVAFPVVAVLLFFRDLNFWKKFSFISAYEFSAGIYSIIIVTGVSLGAARLGVIPTLVITFFIQILVGAVIDHFGLLGMPQSSLTPTKLGALFFMLIGVLLLLKN